MAGDDSGGRSGIAGRLGNFVRRLRGGDHPAAASLLLAVVLAALPLLVWNSWLDAYQVDTPWRDEIHLAPLFDKMNSGSLTATDLLAFHNDHPSTVLYAIFLVNAAYNGAHGDLLSGVTLVGIGFMAFVVLYCFLRPLLSAPLTEPQPGRPRNRVPLLLLPCLAMVLVMFSPLQFANVLYPMGLHMVLPAIPLAAALLVLETVRQPIVRWTVAVLCGLVATFSHGAGLAVWPALFAYGWLTVSSGAGGKTGESGKGRARLVLTLSAGLFLALLLGGLSMLAKGGSIGTYLTRMAEDPLGFVVYFLSYAGLGLSRGWAMPPAWVSVPAGVLVIAAILVLTLATVILGRRGLGGEPWRRSAFWIALLVFVLGSGGLTALARFSIGPEQALASRYATWSLLGLAAIVGWTWQLVLLFRGRVDDAVDEGPPATGRAGAPRGLVFATVVLIPLLAINSAAGLLEMKVASSVVLSCKSYIHVHRIARPEESFPIIGLRDSHKDLHLTLWEKWDYLRPPPLAPDSEISGFRRSSKPLSDTLGFVDEALVLDDGRARFRGTALSSEADRPADLVLFCDPDGRILDATHPAKPEQLWRYSVRGNRRKAATWTKTMALPGGLSADEVEIWMFDMKRYKIYRLRGPEKESPDSA